MFRKILGISIVLIAFILLFLGLRRVWISGGVLGNQEPIDDKTLPVVIEQETGVVFSGLDFGSSGSAQHLLTGEHQAAPTLSIAMPGRMYNESWQIFFARIKKELAMDINFIHPGTIGEYQELITDTNNIDLSLIPSHWYDSLSDDIARVRLPNDMISSLRPERQDLLLSSEGTFFPYLLDPPVIFHSVTLADNSRRELLNQTLRNPEHANFALARGRDDITQALWEKGGEILPGHLALWSHIIASMNDHVEPNNWGDFVSLIQKNSSRNTLRLRSWSTNQEDPYCVDYLPGCLFNAGETSYTLGYLSDLTAWQRYYPDHNRNKLSISPLPLTIGTYDIRGRGWTIHQDSIYHSELLNIMEAYMVGAAEQHYNFWSHTDLSPFVARDSSQRQRPFFETLVPYRYRLNISAGTWDQHREILNDETLIKVLNGEYDPALYFE